MPCSPTCACTCATRSSPAEALRRDQGVDLVVGTRLAGVRRMPAPWSPWRTCSGPIAWTGRTSTPRCWPPEPRSAGRCLLPLSFCLPAVVFLPYNLGEAAAQPERHPGLPAPAAAGNTTSACGTLWCGRVFPRCGNPDFLLVAAELGGARFHEEAGGGLEWDSAALEKTIAYPAGLGPPDQRRRGGGAGFRRTKYLYLPPGRLLDEKRIQFYILRSCDLLRALDEHKEEADFRWLAGAEKILVGDGSCSPAFPAAPAAGPRPRPSCCGFSRPRPRPGFWTSAAVSGWECSASPAASRA